MNTKYFLIFCASLTVFVIAIYNVNKSNLIRAIMPVLCGEKESCLRICCFKTDYCADNEALRNLTDNLALDGLRENYRIIKGVPCEEFHPNENWTFEENGHAIDVFNMTYHWNEYCLNPKEHEMESEDGDEYEYKEEPGESFDMLLTCPPIDVIEDSKPIFPYLKLSSVPFLIATLVIYGLIRELRTLSGKCVMGYVLSLTFMYTFMATIERFNYTMLENYKKTCKVMGYSVIAFILMCFCWLNVMCYDTWKTIKSIRQRGRTSTKFKRYCLYAFGMPILVASLVAALNEFKIVTPEWATGIGNLTCGPFYDKSDEEQVLLRRSQLIYMYGPVSVILVMNFGFFAFTAYTINKVQNEVRRYCTSGSSISTTKVSNRFALYARFFFMMELPWTIDVVSWLLQDRIFMFLASVICCIQNFVIFVTFVFHEKTLKLTMKR